MNDFKILRRQICFTLLTWVSANRDKLPVYVLSVFGLAAALVISGLSLAAFSPYAGEIFSNFLIRVGLIINITLAIATACVVAAAFMYNFGAGVNASFFVESTQRLLGRGSGAWTEPDISPDILICTREGETADEYKARLADARNAANDMQIVVALGLRIPNGIIYADGTRKDFAREMPPFQTPEWTEEQMIVPLNTYFVNESWADFTEYVSKFCYYFREYSARVKLRKQNDPAQRNRVFDNMITSLCISAFLLLTATAGAQSAAAVERAIGTGIRNIPEMGSDISYQFEKKTLGRIGNGRSNYVELLRNIPAYRDCCHGSLIAVYKDGDLVAKGVAAGEVTSSAPTDKMRPRGTSAIEPDRVPGFSLADIPDSNSMVSMAEQAKRQIDQIGAIAGQSIRPWWEVVMHALWTAFPFLLIAGAICWLFAGVCAREGIYDLHKYARRALAIIALFVSAILLVNFLLIAVAMGLGPFGLSVVAAFETYIAYRLVTWLVPDFRPARGNMPVSDLRGHYDNPRLPG